MGSEFVRGAGADAESAALPSTAGRRFSPGVRLLAAGLIAVVWLSLDWVAGYVAYRLGDYREFSGSITSRAGEDPSGARCTDPRYHHGLKPSRIATDTWGGRSYALVTNSLGFKDAAPRVVPLQTARRRLVFIGDSFTEGVGIPYEETWVGQLAEALAPEGIEVLNAGVVSYSAKIAYYKIKALFADSLQFHHLVYFVDVSDVTDDLLLNEFVPANVDADDPWSRRYAKAHYDPPVHEYSLTFRTAHRLLGRDLWRRARFTDRKTGATFLFSNDRDGWARGSPPEWLEAAVASATYYVSKLAALCAAHGITFEIAIYPWPKEIRANDEQSRYRTLWRTFAAEHGLGCYDLHARFMPPDAAARARVVAEHFIPGDTHWNAAGHQLVADEWLRQYRARHGLAAEGSPSL